MLTYDKDHTFNISDFKVLKNIPSYSVYDNYHFKIDVKNKTENTLSKEYHLMDKNIPLHKEIVVSIKDTIPEILKDKSKHLN